MRTLLTFTLGKHKNSFKLQRNTTLCPGTIPHVALSSCVTKFSQIQPLGPGHQIERNIKTTA